MSGKNKHIVALVPRGEVIRNFVYTGCLDMIAERAGLSLLAVQPNKEITSMLLEKYKNVYTLNEAYETWLVRFQREILDMAHGRWLWSKAAQERWRARDFEAKTLKQKTARNVKKVLSLSFASLPGLTVLSNIERASSRILSTTGEYIELYKKIKPTLVFNGSHIHSRNAIQAIQAAQWLKIPTATFVFSWDNLTSQGRITLPYDYYFVWNEILRGELLEMYPHIKPENVFVSGTPQFDFHFQEKYYWSKEEFCARVGADPNRPIVLYSSGMANHMPNEPEIVEEIAEILDEIDLPKKPQLLVRVYPKDLTGRFEKLKAKRPGILFPEIKWEAAWLTPHYEDSYMLVNTLRYSDLGINIASTISLELCMFDKPVINVAYDPPSFNILELRNARFYEFDHYKPVIESGAVQVAYSRNEMKGLIYQCLIKPAVRSTKRKKLIQKMFGETLDGKTARRVAGELMRLA